MRYYAGNAALALLSTLFSIVILVAIVKYAPPIYGKLAASLFFSVLIPVAFLLARNQIREDRIHAAEIFRRTFDGPLGSSVYFEFFERKYYPGIEATNAAAVNVRSMGKYPFPDISSWLLFGASFPFIIFTTAGVFVLLSPAGELNRLLSEALGASPDGAAASVSKDYENAFAIASFAFVAAYLYSLRLLFKSLVAYEPFAIAFLRAFAHMLFAVMLAVMIWRVAPDTTPLVEAATKVQNSVAGANKVTVRPTPEDVRDVRQVPAEPEQISKLWLMLALVFGFLPDYSFSWLLQRTRVTLSRRYRLAAKHAAAAPLTVIDGIDFAKAYRLGEANIAGVQNLAAANPIMLHIETSNCIFLIMDWIAQAQLCAAVGPERFLLFKKINVRTIFDLERAVLDPSSPVGLKQIAGAVLLASDGGKTNLFRDLGVRPLDMAHRDFDRALTSWVNVEVIEHLVRVIMDNLHIHRLRQLWKEIEGSLPPARPEKLPRGGQKILPAAAGPVQQNGGGRETHSHEIAAQGKGAGREVKEIHGD